MKEISEPLQTKNDITITDKLMFFTAQFERGTQVGGHYPCGSCGTQTLLIAVLGFAKTGYV